MIRKLLTAFLLPKVIAYVSRRLKGRSGTPPEPPGLLTFLLTSKPIQETDPQ